MFQLFEIEIGKVNLYFLHTITTQKVLKSCSRILVLRFLKERNILIKIYFRTIWNL